MRHLALLLALAASPAMASDCAENQRAVEHLYGTSCVPETPLRIVTTVSNSVAVPLIELGLMPVGSAGRLDAEGKPFLRGSMNLTGISFENSGITYIGGFNPLDYEAIASVEPDLILHGVWGAQNVVENYERLSKIAPTVAFDTQANTGLERHARIAEATGQSERLTNMRALYDTQIAQLKSLAPEDTSVSVLQGHDGQMLLFHTYPSLGKILRDAGFTLPALFDSITPGARQSFSGEMLPEVDADWLILTYRSERDETPQAAYDAMEAVVPGWCDVLSACRDGRVIYLPRSEASAGSITASVAVIYALISHMSDPARQP